MEKDYLEELENDEVIMEIYYKFYMNVVTAIIHNIDGLSKLKDTEYRQYIKKTSKEIVDKVNREVLRINNEVKKDIGNKYKKSASKKMSSMEYTYEKEDVPLIMTKKQLDIVSNAASKAYKETKKLNSQLPSKAKKDYLKCVNKYSKQITKGNITLQEATKRATEEVRKKGIRMSYKTKDGTEVNVEPDVAVRRNLLWNMSEASNEISENIAEELGLDGAETSAHSGARPSHQIWQGRQFALGPVGKVVDGTYYQPFDMYKDELNDYNCRHSWNPVRLGTSTPAYSKQELKKMAGKMVMYKGRRITEYEGTQIQRRLETQIRHQKRNIEVLKKTGKDYTKENELLQKYYKNYREASKEMKLDQRYDRLRIF